MPLPDFDENGDLPPGVYPVTLVETRATEFRARGHPARSPSNRRHARYHASQPIDP